MSHIFIPTVNEALYTATERTTNQDIVGPDDVTWDTPDAGVTNGIAFSSSKLFTLLANRTYELTAFILTTAADTYTFEWVDSANAPVGAVNAPGINADRTFVESVFTPLVDTDVKVRLTTTVNVTVISPSWVVIKTLD